ncbi:MAG TPA: TonB-dependent receptor, partial [Stellaceae bacterium]|nr:TonB-dependent receptor [Stellaceae bacterium]
GAEGENAIIHVSFSGASNLINAIGPTPVQLLNARESAVFTTPQATRNDLAQVTLTGSYKLQQDVSLDGTFYFRSFRQHISNGNTTNAQNCDPAVSTTALCFGDGQTLLFATNGQPIPNILNGATPGEIDRTATTSDGLGGSAQVTETTPLFDHTNHFVAGVSLDHGSSNFTTNSELGVIQPNLLVSGLGFLIDEPQGDLAPVNLDSTNTYYGIYATDTFDVTSRLAVTLSGRYNLALINLTDLAGTGLSGDHQFSRFNPAAGATYKILPHLTAYAGYSEANRAPTPGELGCANPARPCIIDNFLVSDPNLQQVVAHTYEAGVRGAFDGPEARSTVNWSLGFFRTDTDNDILNVPSALSGFGFFQNVGASRRQGVEAGLNYKSDRWFAYADYSFIDATFQSTITLSSPNNPMADANGNITVHPGDHLPSIPEHRGKLGADYFITPEWRFGADLLVASGQFLRGDEANQNPEIPGYAVVNLHSSYDITEHIQIFGLIQNLFDERYDTFGLFFNTASIPSLGLTNPRSLSPAPPFGAFVGLRASF